MDLKSYIYGIQPGRYGFQALFDRACKIFALMFLMLLSSEIRSQDVVYWRTGAINGNWEWGLDCTSAGTDGWWYYQTSGNGNRKRPDCSAPVSYTHLDVYKRQYLYTILVVINLSDQNKLIAIRKIQPWSSKLLIKC